MKRAHFININAQLRRDWLNAFAGRIAQDPHRIECERCSLLGPLEVSPDFAMKIILQPALRLGILLVSSSLI